MPETNVAAFPQTTRNTPSSRSGSWGQQQQQQPITTTTVSLDSIHHPVWSADYDDHRRNPFATAAASHDLPFAFYSSSNPNTKTRKEKTPSSTRKPSSRSEDHPSPTTNEEEEEVVVSPLPPVIQSIADERMEYQMNVGKAMDVLRRDYQDMFTKRPDFSIYDKRVTLVDPSGVQIRGLENYKSALAFFQTFLGFWFSLNQCRIQFRMVYDFCRCSIRISWHVVFFPKSQVSAFFFQKPLHVDGISYYQLDRQSGKIVEHKIENLTINQSPVQPPYGIFSLLQQDELRRSMKRVPVGALTGSFQ